MLHAVIYDIETYTYNAVYWLQIKSKNLSKTTFRTINSMHSIKNIHHFLKNADVN